MSKSRIRVIVTLLALAFSLTSMSVVTEARDGMPRDGMPKRKVRRHRKVIPPNNSNNNSTANNNSHSVVPPDNRPDVEKKDGTVLSKIVGGVGKAARKFGKIISGKGSKGTGPVAKNNPPQGQDQKPLDF